MPNPTDEMVLELYLKLEEIYYSDARTIEDKVLHIRKTLEGFYKIIAGKDINSRTSLLELEKEVIIFEAVPREVIGLMKKLRIKLNPSAHFNDYEYSEEEYINLIKSIYAIIRFIAKVEFTDRSKRIFDTLVKPESVFDGLNQMQLLAVQTTDPFVFVNAGPGTGKTHLVAYRILHKLESLASDKNIIALSFTNLSAGELKSRVDDLILTSPYVDKLKQIYSGTIHAFCLDQFRAYYENTDDEKYNLNVIEEANGIKRLIEEFDMTHESAADALGKSRVAVSNLLRLLNLTERVQAALLEKKIEMGHARALISLEASDQVMLCQKIISQKLSVREVENLVSATKLDAKGRLRSKSEDIRIIENEISESIGLKVSIHHNQKGNGYLKISYSNLDEIQQILDKLK